MNIIKSKTEKICILQYSFNLIEISPPYIELNEYYKIKDREDMYFTHIQPYQHHTNIPDTSDRIYVYSFALQPEDYQPSGTCNFSRLKFGQIISTTGRGIRVYATNYNILKITSGMGGLVFPN